MQNQKIDIRQLFRDKNPRLARLIPGFVYRYLKRILHVDFINYLLEKHGNKKGIDFAQASIDEFNIRVTINGFENLPEGGKYVFASNHPLGGFDGMLLITILSKKYEYLNVLVNDLLTNIRNMDEIFVPINKHGRQSLDAARQIEKVFKSDAQVLTFPAGLVSRKSKGIIRDPEWKKNFITKAVKHQRDVIPIHVSGRCSNFFYRLANLRKFLGIKSNIEMLYLADETYQHRNEHITVTMGYPIKWTTFNKRYKPEEWASKVQDYVYQLPKGKNPPFGYTI